MIRSVIALGVVVLLASACDKKEMAAPVAADTSATLTVPVAPPPTAAEPTVDLANLPVEEQYEAEAARGVTAANVSSELDSLEKEIAAP